MESYEGVDAIERAWRDGFKPGPLLTVSHWSDQYRVLSQRAPSEPGRWRTQPTPYLKEIMNCLSPSSPVQRVPPGPMMAVAPTVELAKRDSRQRIDPLIEESEVLRSRVKERRSGNTVLSKDFPGGVLILTEANSAVGLRSMPARYLFLDEVDGYPRRRRGRRRSDPAGRAAIGHLPAPKNPAGLYAEEQGPVADRVRIRGKRSASLRRAVSAPP